MSTNPPRVDIPFIENAIKKSNKYLACIESGKTKAYIQSGTKPISKRMVVLRKNSTNNIDLDKAVAIAYRFGFMTDLLEHLKDNHGYIDGGFDEKAINFN